MPESTVPSDDSEDVANREPPALRWVFPRLDGAVTPLGSGGLLLGRGEECDVQLAGEETSRRHAEIRRNGPLWVIRDLDSRNGTFVNGERISSAPLALGDLVRLGNALAVVVAASDLSDQAGPAYTSFAPGLFGGPAMRPLLNLARQAAASTLPVIVEGETGTGKEGLARALHTWSGRKGPFVAVNCGAIPEALAEGELFGYRKGAFTGAERAHLGYFRAADGGTLLLDEVVELPLPLQTKLLRVLEQRELVPLGESAPVTFDVRIVVAAQEPLAQAVKERRFRADLFARLDGLALRLPPLRDRRDEIPFLATRLLDVHSGGRPPRIETRAIERLCLHDWPFNVRELDLLVRRLLVLRPDGPVRKADLPQAVRSPSARKATPESADETTSRPARPPRPRTPEDRRARDEQDLAALRVALRAEGGNVVRAARSAGMTRQRAYRLMGQRADTVLGAMRARPPLAGES